MCSSDNKEKVEVKEARIEGVIPPQIYKIIVEILSFVYKINNEYSNRFCPKGGEDNFKEEK